MNLLNTKT